MMLRRSQMGGNDNQANVSAISTGSAPQATGPDALVSNPSEPNRGSDTGIGS
jgi:hypothetical protein